jgi:hypothetical protein
MKIGWALGLLVAGSVGCGGVEEELNPLGADAGTITTTTIEDAGTGGSGGGAPDAGAPIRTVMTRNPFGNVAERENLLWDGDFEWHSAFSDQYGWLAGSSVGSLGFGFSDVRLGATCRSGLKCAGMKKNRVIAGIAVASQGNKIEVSFWAKVAMGDCSDVSASVIPFGDVNDPSVLVKPVSTEPDADGWCQFDSVLDPRKGKPVLLIQNQTGADIVVDDAVIKKVAPEMSVKAYHGPPSAKLAEEIEAARQAISRTRGPHEAPRNAAQRAFEAWSGKKR